MFFELFIVLRNISALRALGFASMCYCTTPQSATRLEQNTAKAEVMGYWLWTGACGVAAIHAPNLSPYRLLPHRLITFNL